MNRKESLIVTISIIIVIGGMMVIMGIPWAGYHLVDDHEFMAYTYMRIHDHASLPDLIGTFIHADLNNGRWRPLYAIFRVLFIWVLGTDISLYHIWSVIRTIIVFLTLYTMSRAMGADKGRSYLCSFISLTGYQSAAWWKLGPQEMTATFWFAAGMTLMIICVREISETGYCKGIKKAAIPASLICFAIMGLYKESYILLMPFVFLYAVYEIAGHGLAKSIRKCIPYLICLCLTALIELIMIFTLTNADYLSGEDKSFSLRPLIDSFKNDLKWYLIFGIALTILAVCALRKNIKNLLFEFILLCVFVLPQFYLYSQSGISERYILPLSVGFSVFFVIWVPEAMIRAESPKIIQYIYYIVLAALLIIHAVIALSECRYYKYRCDSMEECLELLDETISMRPDDDPPAILSCLYAEGGYLIYLHELLQGVDNVYNNEVNFNDMSYSILPMNYDYLFFSEQPVIDYGSLDDIDIVVIYNTEDRHFAYEPDWVNSFDLSDFVLKKCKTIDVYIRNELISGQ